MKLEWLEPTTATETPARTELDRVGVLHERLQVSAEDYQPTLDRYKADRGYLEQDIVELNPQTPNLGQICAKFADEHLHSDDEVRFVLEGEGIFDVRSADDRWLRITVQKGDLLVVPANLHHRFCLTQQQLIRCVRLFKDTTGWVPHYRGQ